MSRFATGTFAGVALTYDGEALRVEITSGADVRQDPYSGQLQTALDGTPHLQLVETLGRGREAGINIAYCPIVKLNELRTAVHAAMAAGTTFNVNVTDENTTINKQVLPLYPTWLEFSSGASSGIVKDVELRFVIT